MGKYVIDGLLGPGGVTETYLVHLDEAAGRKPGAAGLYALKLLRPDRVPAGAFARVARRFLSAASQLRDFHRPGFARVVDLSEDPAATFMVSEHVAGCDLGRLLETCQAEGKTGVHALLVGLIASELARLLHVAHSAKPVFAHLGLGPQNVMVAPSGEVIVLDAGIAASLRALTEQPAERWALVAPELQGVDVGGGPLADRAAVAADLYSLGALMYFLIAGHPPGTSWQDEAAMAGLGGNLVAALRTLLSPEPDDRPSDAAVLVEWLAGDVVQARQRQRLIAQGVHATEKGLRLSSPDLPAIVTAPADPPAAVAPSRHEQESPRRPGARRSGIAWPLLVLAGCGAAVLGAVCLMVGPSSRQAAEVGASATPPSVPDLAKARARLSEAMPERLDGAVGGPHPARNSLPNVNMAGHLVVETIPPGASLWVDGMLRGKTFADLMVGGGRHRVALIAPGYRMFSEVVDTSSGAIVRRTLSEIAPASAGNGATGFIDVRCRTSGQFPVLLDEQETGVLCPASMLPTTSGKHTVGIFVPAQGRAVTVETSVEGGSKPASVGFSQ